MWDGHTSKNVGTEGYFLMAIYDQIAIYLQSVDKNVGDNVLD